MSDRYAGQIYIGGVLPARKLAALARTIENDDPDIEMNWSLGDDRRITVELLLDWLKRRVRPMPLHLYANELTDGSFPVLESWLVANEMSYLRHSDSYSDVEAEIVGYVNGKHIRYDANNAGDVMVHASGVQRAYDALCQGRVFDAMDALSAIVPVVTEVGPFTVKYARKRSQ